MNMNFIRIREFFFSKISTSVPTKNITKVDNEKMMVYKNTIKPVVYWGSFETQKKKVYPYLLETTRYLINWGSPPGSAMWFADRAKP